MLFNLVELIRQLPSLIRQLAASLLQNRPFWRYIFVAEISAEYQTLNEEFNYPMIMIQYPD